MTAPTRLFGRPGAEILHADIAGVYESEIDPWLDEEPGPETQAYEIEEWTVADPRRAFPAGDRIAEWITETVADEGEGDEGFFDDVERAAIRAQAVEWFDAVVAAWAKRMTYRMADRKVASHLVTWNAAGEPLLDGEPMYARRPPCPTCGGMACEEGCGSCWRSPSVAGPDAHRQCRTCHGTGVAEGS